MRFLHKLRERFASNGSSGQRRVRYSALAIAIAGLAWSMVVLAETRHRAEKARVHAVDFGRAVSELRLQVARQRSAAGRASYVQAEDEATSESLVARVGEAARKAGLILAQSRVVTVPGTAPAPPPQQSSGAQAAPASAPSDGFGVEFHLAGSYAALQRLLRALAASRSRFQITTLDVLRAGVDPGSGSARLDIRLVCIL